MEIYPLGHSSFKIKGKTLPAGRQGATVVTDPYDSTMVGLKFPKLESVDIVTISHDHRDHNVAENVPGTPFVIAGPGEYEIKGVTVIGVPTFHDDKNGVERGANTVYKMTIDGINICHLGDLGHKLSDDQLNQIGNVEVLLIPVGGAYTVDAKVAAEVVAQIEPLVVIPMHYKRSDNPDVTVGKLGPLSDFLGEMGVAGGVAPQPKLAVSKDRLPETTTVVVLE